MKPKAIDALQMTHDSLPTIAATAPIENNTSGGTPLATQKAPVQSMRRSSLPLDVPLSASATAAGLLSTAVLTVPSPIGRAEPRRSRIYRQRCHNERR